MDEIIPNIDPNGTPVNPEPQPVQPVQPEIASPTPTKKFPVLGVIVLVILLGGGAALAYMFYPTSPEKVMAAMVSKVAQLNSFEFSGKVNLELNMTGGFAQDSQNRKINGVLEIEGASDSSDINNPKVVSLVKVSGEGLVMSMDLRSVAKKLYVRLNEAPLLGFFDTGSIKNQWIVVDLAELEQQANGSSTQLTEEQKRKLTEAFVEHNFIKFSEKMDDETLNGVATYHYKLVLDKEEFKQFMVVFYENIGIYNSGNPAPSTEDLNKELNQFELTTAEVWIGKKDQLPYRVLMSMNFNSQDAAYSGNGKISYDFNFRNHNMPVTVEVPSNAKTFQELFGGADFSPPGMMPPPSIPDQDFDFNFENNLEMDLGF